MEASASFSICVSTAPNPYEETSADTIVGLLGWQNNQTGAELSCCFIVWKAFCLAGPHIHKFFVLNKSHKGLVMLDKCGVNLLIWLVIPRNRRNSVMFVGSVIVWIALTLSRSGLIPDWSMIWPKNLTLFLETSHLALFKVIFVTRSDKNGLIAHDRKCNFFTQIQNYVNALLDFSVRHGLW